MKFHRVLIKLFGNVLFEFLFNLSREIANTILEPLVEVELMLSEKVDGGGRDGEVWREGFERPREDIDRVNCGFIAKKQIR